MFSTSIKLVIKMLEMIRKKWPACKKYVYTIDFKFCMDSIFIWLYTVVCKEYMYLHSFFSQFVRFGKIFFFIIRRLRFSKKKYTYFKCLDAILISISNAKQVSSFYRLYLQWLYHWPARSVNQVLFCTMKKYQKIAVQELVFAHESCCV